MPQKIAVKLSSDLQAMVVEDTQTWACRDIHILVSRDFAAERALHATGRSARLHGSDTTLESGIIGSYLSKQPFRIGLQPATRERFEWLAPYLETEAGAVAAVMIAKKMAPVFQRSNPFYLRQQRAYREQFAGMHAKMLEKVASWKFGLASFFLGGVAELLEGLPPEAGVITHVGTWKPDLKAEAALAAIFDWDIPTFLPITKKADELPQIERITSRPNWLLIIDRELEHLAPQLRGSVLTTNRWHPTYVYGSAGAQRITRPQQKIEPILNPRLVQDQEIGERLSLADLTSSQFDSLRATYMNANIRPSTKTRTAFKCVAVLVDGLIIGAYALSTDISLCNWGDYIISPQVYMLSDFAVGPTDYPRLSKLVVMAALSHEGKLLAQRMDGQVKRALVTTAFSRRPSSMKYRGLLDLLVRNEEKDNPDIGGDGYKLTYGGTIGRWSLAEAMADWKKRHGQRKLSPAENLA